MFWDFDDVKLPTLPFGTSSSDLEALTISTAFSPISLGFEPASIAFWYIC